MSLACVDDLSGCYRTEYRVDAGPLTPGTTATIDGEGAHVLSYRSIDRFGNAEPFRSLNVFVDRSGPTAAFETTASEPAAGGWTRGSWTLASVTCDDRPSGSPAGASGCAGVDVSIDGEPFQPFTGARSLDTEGRHEIRARVSDKAGNRAIVSTLLGIDRTPPTPRMTNDNNEIIVAVGGTPLEAVVDDGQGSGAATVCFDVTRIDVVTGERQALGCLAADRQGDHWTAHPALGPGRYEVMPQATDLVGLTGVGEPVRLTVVSLPL